MAQMTDAISMKDCELSISSNGSDWTDRSGYASSVDAPDSERAVGEAYTFDGDTGIVTPGKRTPFDLLVSTIYSEGAIWDTVRAAHEAGTKIYIRYSPKGGDSTDYMYTTPACTIRRCGYPGGGADDANPVRFPFVLRVPYLTKSVIA